jgi:uncharacterized protein YebE (UPF0316 family)
MTVQEPGTSSGRSKQPTAHSLASAPLKVPDPGIDDLNTWLVSLTILVLRICDVSIGTVRIVMLVRDRIFIAGVLGVAQSLVWIYAAGIVLTNLDSPPRIIAFALGFGIGSVLGSLIERQLALGHSILRAITPVGDPCVANELRRGGYGVTVVNAEGLDGEVRVAFTVVPRKRTADVLERIRRTNPHAFVTLESVKTPDLAPHRHRIRP